MKPVKVDSQTVYGISVRTRNANEMNPETAKIGDLWQRFYEQVTPEMKAGANIYGVYYNYESDAGGEFSVLAGAAPLLDTLHDLEKVTLEAGDYLLFEGKGDMPQTVINTWTEIWGFFAANTDYKRAYTTDFELYKSEDEIAIYIAIQ